MNTDIIPALTHILMKQHYDSDREHGSNMPAAQLSSTPNAFQQNGGDGEGVGMKCFILFLLYSSLFVFGTRYFAFAFLHFLIFADSLSFFCVFLSFFFSFDIYNYFLIFYDC